MQNEYDAIAEFERVPQREQIVTLFGVVVAVGSGGVEFFGVPHADQVAGDEAPEPFEVRHDVAPQVGGRGIAVLEHDGVTLTLVDEGHPFAVDLPVL